MTRLSEYRIMWIMVLFDLPTETSEDRHVYSVFRKQLQKDGFRMFQFSAYMRHCASEENAQVHIERIKRWLPEKGHIGIMKFTDKQFGMMQVFYGRVKNKNQPETPQLMLF